MEFLSTKEYLETAKNEILEKFNNVKKSLSFENLLQLSKQLTYELDNYLAVLALNPKENEISKELTSYLNKKIKYLYKLNIKYENQELTDNEDNFSNIYEMINIVFNVFKKYIFDSGIFDSSNDEDKENEALFLHLINALNLEIDETQTINLNELKDRFVKIANSCFNVGFGDNNSLYNLILNGDKLADILTMYLVNKYNLFSPGENKFKKYSLSKIKDFIPENIFDFIKFNRSVRNKFVHEDIKLTESEFNIYKQNLAIIVDWVNSKYHFDESDIANLRKENEELKTKQEESESIIKQNLELLKQVLANQGIQLENQARIENKIDELKQDILNLNDQLKDYKEMIQPAIENSANLELFEQTIAKFQDTTVEKISHLIGSNTTVKTYKDYETQLKNIFTEPSYNKLDDDCKEFIITSKIMYDNLSSMEGDFDYSGVCLLLTKALEKECKKRFYYGYLKYMKSKYGEDTSYYPLWCIKVKIDNNKQKYETILDASGFTLGKVAFATGYIKDKSDNSDLYLTMNDYCEDELFINNNPEHVASTLKKIGKDVQQVTNLYRNPSAHIEKVKKVKATECFDYLINVQKLIQFILNETRI